MEIQRRTNVPPLGISHRAVSTTYLFDYRIPKETIILPSLYSIHMDPLYWRDPLAFRPERHIKNGKIFFEEKHFAPFGYGKELQLLRYFLFPSIIVLCLLISR